MAHTSRLTGILLTAFGMMASVVVQAQDTPYNASPSSPCPEVLIEQKYDHVVNPSYQAMGWDTAVTTENPVIELMAEPYIPVKFFNGTYLVEEIPYNPPDTTFSSGTILSNPEDIFTSPVNIPYPFYFFGIRKNQFRLGANGLVTFCDDASFGSGNSCPYSYSAPLPWPDGTAGAPGSVSGGTTARMRDAIYGVYEDTYPFLCTSNDGIFYGIQDQYPCRKIICSWKNVPLYGSGCNSLHSSYQIVCYEGTNIIEVHVKQRQVCTNWYNGIGLIGIQNATGTAQQPSSMPSDPNYCVVSGSPACFAPSGYNTFNTSVDSVAFRFTPQGQTNMTSEWFRLMDNGDAITLTTNPTDTNGYYLPMGSDTDHPTLTRAIVSPTSPSRYVMHLSFRNANNDWYHLYDTISVGIDTALNYTVTVLSSDTTLGTVSGGGVYRENTTATVAAYAQGGITFEGWDNGEIVNPLPILVTSDTTLVAQFDTPDTVYIHDTVYVGVDGVEVLNAKVYVSQGRIVVEGAEEYVVTLYDINGREIERKVENGARKVFDVPASGSYLIKVGDLPARKVVVIR